MKKFIKISLLVFLSAGFIYFLSQRKIINFHLLSQALLEHKILIFGIACAQILNHLSMAYRYKYILKFLGLEKKTTKVLSSTFISNAIGQWLPGSLAFIEIIRINLVLKRSKGIGLTPHDKFHLTTASLFDRIIGLFVALVLGTVLTFYFLLRMSDKTSANFYILSILFLFNLSLTIFILILPIIAGSKPLQKILARCERLCLKFISHTVAQQVVMNIFHKINSLIKVFAENGKKYNLFWIPIGLSLMSIGSFTLAMHFAWLAVNSNIPLLETLALNSTLALSVAIPISVGGIGAPQLIAAILYGAFGANAAFAASAQLLVIGINLIAISAIGIIYLPRIIKEIIKPRIA